MLIALFSPIQLKPGTIRTVTPGFGLGCGLGFWFGVLIWGFGLRFGLGFWFRVLAWILSFILPVIRI